MADKTLKRACVKFMDDIERIKEIKERIHEEEMEKCMIFLDELAAEIEALEEDIFEEDVDIIIY